MRMIQPLTITPIPGNTPIGVAMCFVSLEKKKMRRASWDKLLYVSGLCKRMLDAQEDTSHLLNRGLCKFIGTGSFIFDWTPNEEEMIALDWEVID